jgi:hypothetical protein
MSPNAFLEQGARLISSKLEPLGFRFELLSVASGSGGPFAEGVFSRGDRQLILWVRFDRLGGVRYRIGASDFDHETYMRAMGREKEARYPGLPDDDSFGGFRRLLADLDLCGDVLDGDAESVLEMVASLPAAATGFAALST